MAGYSRVPRRIEGLSAEDTSPSAQAMRLGWMATRAVRDASLDGPHNRMIPLA